MVMKYECMRNKRERDRKGEREKGMRLNEKER